MFQLMFVYYTLSSDWIDAWPPVWKWLPARYARCSHCIVSTCNFYYLPFWILKSGIMFLIAQVPVHCLLVSFITRVLMVVLCGDPKSLPTHPFNALILPISRGCNHFFSSFMSLESISFRYCIEGLDLTNIRISMPYCFY